MDYCKYYNIIAKNSWVYGNQKCNIIHNYYMQMNNSDQLLTRADKERARKHAKRARESSVERSRSKEGNRQRNKRCRASESEAERLQRLAASQQREANCRDSESEAEHVRCLAAGQQRDASRRASESDTKHEHRVNSN